MNHNSINQKLALLRAQGLNYTVECFIRLHYQSGARIGDLLSITRNHISNNLTIIIDQGKGSNPLIISPVEDRQFWEEYRSGLHVDISCFSVSFFYKLYKRYGFSISNGAGRNNSVTHSARKLKAREVYATTGEIRDAQAALGHKRESSTLYYLNDRKPANILRGGIDGRLSGKLGVLKFRSTKRGNYINL